MNFENIYDLFVSSCMKNGVVFNSVDILNFMNCCNIKPDALKLKTKIKNTNFQNYNHYKSFLSPSIFFPKNNKLNSINYNLSKIMLELKLENQKISPKDKMDKILNYIKYVS